MIPIRKFLAAGALACSLAAPALGQCDIYRWNVPDFDQKRDALPGDGGMYCVPTSAVNWMAYISNHGFGPMMAGPRNWQSNANYGFVTTTDALMGSLMDTSATGGTTGDDGLDGLRAYMFSRAPYAFSASAWYGGITPFDMYLQMLSNGLVNVCYGYYKQFTLAGTTFYARDGGHCVTLNGIVNVCGSGHPVVRLRNPADDDNLFSQSTFSTITSRAIVETFPSAPLPGITNTLTRMADFGTSSTTRRYLDCMYVIRSNFACWTPATPVPEIKIFKFVTFFGDPQPQEVTFRLPAGAIANAIAIHPDQTKAAYVQCSPGPAGQVYRLHILNLADGSDQDLGLLLPAVQGITPIDFDRFGRLIACDGSVLKVFDLAGRVPAVVASRELVSPASSVCFDDALNEIVVLTPANRRILRLPMNLDGGFDEPLPTGTPAVLGDGSVIPDPTAPGRYLLTTSSSPTVYELTLAAGTPRFLLNSTLLLPAVQAIQKVMPGDGGVFVLGDGSVHVLDRDPTANRLRLAPMQPFANLPQMRTASISRSRTNFDPDLHTGPAWFNLINPDEGVASILDCPADFNLNGVVTVQDLFDFLAAYFSSNPQADINGSASISVQDIFDYLAAYFAGCP